MNERDGRKVLQRVRERDREAEMEREICIRSAKLQLCVASYVSLSSKCVFVGRQAFTSSRTPDTNLKDVSGLREFRILFAQCRRIRENQ